MQSNFLSSGIALIAVSFILLFGINIMRHNSFKIPIDFFESIQSSLENNQNKKSSRTRIIVLWILSISLHALLLEIGIYIIVGFHGTILMLIYICPFLIFGIFEIRRLGDDALEHFEVSLMRIQEIHSDKKGPLMKQTDNLVKNVTHNAGQRIALLQYLAKRNDSTGRIALELLESCNS